MLSAKATRIRESFAVTARIVLEDIADGTRQIDVALVTLERQYQAAARRFFMGTRLANRDHAQRIWDEVGPLADLRGIRAHLDNPADCPAFLESIRTARKERAHVRT